jgi:hypothetical protein
LALFPECPVIALTLHDDRVNAQTKPYLREQNIPATLTPVNAEQQRISAALDRKCHIQPTQRQRQQQRRSMCAAM